MGLRHFVATGYVVQGERTLLLLHKKLGMWLPPGGHIDEGELPEEALLREIKEETGLEVEILSPRREPDASDPGVRYLHVPSHVQLETLPGHGEHIDLIYFCLAEDGEAAFRDEEHHDMKWCSIEELQDPRIRGEVRDTGSLAIRYVREVCALRRSAGTKPSAEASAV